MHIVDGVLSAPVLVGGVVLTAGGIALGLRSLTLERVPAAGVLSATFFVATLIHVPVGPSSVHLIMNGLAGLLLSWVAFPALFVGLVLQAVFFGYGGLTVLGVNTLVMALPAVVVGLLFRRLAMSPDGRLAALAGFLAGALGIVLAGSMVALVLWLSGAEFIPIAKFVVLAHVPIALIDGLVCAAAVALIHRVKPELLGTLMLSPRPAPTRRLARQPAP